MEEKTFKNLLLLGHDAAEKAAQEADPEKISGAQPGNDGFYGGLLHALMNLSLPEDEAKSHWTEIVRHKWYMSEQLKRNVGIRVAALDYFHNIKGLVKKPKIVEVTEFADISWKAVTDSLTGLYNHRYFQNAVNAEIKRMKEEDSCFSVVMLDIDFFKVYNDANGHVAGDVVLLEVAEIIRTRAGDNGVASRYGGEEFAVILPGAGAEHAMRTAEEIRMGVAGAGFANEEVMPAGKVTISCGVAAAPGDGTTRRDIISAADSRLYRAKRSGRDRVCSGEQ